jgi:hypothetical protein
MKRKRSSSGYPATTLSAWIVLERRSFSLADRFAFIVTVNKGIKPSNHWALLLQMSLSAIDFNLWTRASLTTPLKRVAGIGLPASACRHRLAGIGLDVGLAFA